MMPYGYAASIAYGMAQGAKYPEGKMPETRWVVHWKDHHEVFESFELAQTDFLDFLWFWGEEFVHADANLYREIMDGWDVTRKWKERRSEDIEGQHYDITVRGEKYGMTRLDLWEGRSDS